MTTSNEAFQTTSFFEPDFAAGVSYSWGTNTTAQVISNNGYDGIKVNIGTALHRVASPSYSFLGNNKDGLNFNFRYVLHANTSFGLGGSNIAIQPNGFFAFQQKATEFLMGMYLRYNLKEVSKYTKFSNGAALSIGMHLRVGDAFVPSVLIETGKFAFGISYDFNISGLSSVSNGQGGYEFSIRYVSPNPFGTRTSQARFF